MAQYRLLPRFEAFQTIHFPDSPAHLLKAEFRIKFGVGIDIFDDLLTFSVNNNIVDKTEVISDEVIKEIQNGDLQEEAINTLVGEEANILIWT